MFTCLTGAYRTLARNRQDFVQLMPTWMSFEMAASIPFVYCTAYQGLVTVAHIQREESVLIHAAAGGVGQAAIQLARQYSAKIFATTDTDHKRELLVARYNIPRGHIFSVQDLTFAKKIMDMTDGKGVDIILNSLAGEALRVSWHCIAAYGRFIQMGRQDIYANTGLDMIPFLKNATFSCVNVEYALQHGIAIVSSTLEAVADLLRRKVIMPVDPVTVTPLSELEQAFRSVQADEHLGKVVINFDGKHLVPVRVSHWPLS